MERCVNYCGITCVNGYYPNALATEYPEYGYEHCTCEECGFFMMDVKIALLETHLCVLQWIERDKL